MIFEFLRGGFGHEDVMTEIEGFTRDWEMGTVGSKDDHG